MKDHLVRDDLETCPYLPDQTARMPLYVPEKVCDAADTDRRLARGQRRAGEFVYQTNCPHCQACIPIRLDVEIFRPNQSQRRALAKGEQRFTMTVGDLVADQQRVDLFNKHRHLRKLGKHRDAIDMDDYKWGFVRSCFDSFELAFWETNSNEVDSDYSSDPRLIMVAICDRGKDSVSAVYTYYDPDFPKISLGTFGIMKQIEYCQRQDLKYLYLGYYIEQCRPMNYKNRFQPHEKLLDGKWTSSDQTTSNDKQQ